MNLIKHEERYYEHMMEQIMHNLGTTNSKLKVGGKMVLTSYKWSYSYKAENLVGYYEFETTRIKEQKHRVIYLSY